MAPAATCGGGTTCRHSLRRQLGSNRFPSDASTRNGIGRGGGQLLQRDSPCSSTMRRPHAKQSKATRPLPSLCAAACTRSSTALLFHSRSPSLRQIRSMLVPSLQSFSTHILVFTVFVSAVAYGLINNKTCQNLNRKVGISATVLQQKKELPP